MNPANPGGGPYVETLRTTARFLKLELQAFEVRGPNELDSTFSEMAKQRIGAVVIQDDTLFLVNLKAIVDLVARHRLPSAGSLALVEAGGLVGYQQDIGELDRRSAIYVIKILKGARPGDLPIQQPTKFELVVNLKTAKALGLTIPPAVLARTDRVIE